ncbi:MAG: DM13 domain-containing protein [Patescibacteria group bacterium]
MKKLIIIIAVLILGGFGYWTISPFFIDKRVSEELDFSNESEQPVLVWRGLFKGFDSIHTGTGNVSVLKAGDKYIIRFEENFDVANGPDLYVGFGKDGKYVKGTEIAKLKGNIGSQNYEVPANINLEEYNEIWIWCRAFSVGFAKAKLTPSI